MTTDPTTTLDHDVLDAAMHAVWLYGKWRYITSCMSGGEREAAAAAVERHNAWMCRQSGDAPVSLTSVRWWEDDTVAEIIHRTPPSGSATTPCCRRSPFEISRTDRITNDDRLVTCGKER